MSENSANEPNRMISASVGMAVPGEHEHYGYLSEHHAYGETEEKSGDYAEDLVCYHAGQYPRYRIRSCKELR